MLVLVLTLSACVLFAQVPASSVTPVPPPSPIKQAKAASMLRWPRFPASRWQHRGLSGLIPENMSVEGSLSISTNRPRKIEGSPLLNWHGLPNFTVGLGPVLAYEERYQEQPEALHWGGRLQIRAHLHQRLPYLQTEGQSLSEQGQFQHDWLFGMGHSFAYRRGKRVNISLLYRLASTRPESSAFAPRSPWQMRISYQLDPYQSAFRQKTDSLLQRFRYEPAVSVSLSEPSQLEGVLTLFYQLRPWLSAGVGGFYGADWQQPTPAEQAQYGGLTALRLQPMGQGLFAQGEYRLANQLTSSDAEALSSPRHWQGQWVAGVGYSLPMGRKSLQILSLYTFEQLNSWSVRIGLNLPAAPKPSVPSLSPLERARLRLWKAKTRVAADSAVRVYAHDSLSRKGLLQPLRQRFMGIEGQLGPVLFQERIGFTATPLMQFKVTEWLLLGGGPYLLYRSAGSGQSEEWIYGGRASSRVLFKPLWPYLQAEYQVVRQPNFTVQGGSTDSSGYAWTHSLLVGAGADLPLSAQAALQVQALYGLGDAPAERLSGGDPWVLRVTLRQNIWARKQAPKGLFNQKHPVR